MAPQGTESVEIRAALLRMRRATGLPVAFGGLMEAGGRQVRIRELSGTGTIALRGLAVSSGNGLGGKAAALSRPCAVTDYAVARHISHEYDGAVRAEGLRSVLAVPVVVRRRVRGVLYGALRTAQPLGDRTLDAAVAAARDVEQALVLRDEVASLVAAGVRHGPGSAPATAGAGSPAVTGAGMPTARTPWAAAPPSRPDAGPDEADARVLERVREAHGALRALAPRIVDPALRAELLSVCARLAPSPGDSPGVALTPRELDVLASVATGATNAVAARQLGLRPETVKAYLRSAMRKLGAHTRWQAVVSARRAGVLP
ncbi:LuxR C-terminal-related transcriptional regulator [Streptomyces sp. NPDC002004]